MCFFWHFLLFCHNVFSTPVSLTASWVSFSVFRCCPQWVPWGCVSSLSLAFFLFFGHAEAYRILVSRPGNPGPCVWKHWVLTTEPTENSQLFSFILCFKKFIYLLIHFWLCWVFVAAQAFLQLLGVGITLWLPSMDFSLQWFVLLPSTGSRAHRLQ